MNTRGSDEKKITISEEDTERLRVLLSLESGWEQKPANTLPVDLLLVLDNIQYIISSSREISEIRYSVVTDNISAERKYGLSNENLEVVQEVYDIVGKYVDEK